MKHAVSSFISRTWLHSIIQSNDCDFKGGFPQRWNCNKAANERIRGLSNRTKKMRTTGFLKLIAWKSHMKLESGSFIGRPCVNIGTVGDFNRPHEQYLRSTPSKSLSMVAERTSWDWNVNETVNEQIWKLFQDMDVHELRNYPHGTLNFFFCCIKVMCEHSSTLPM